ncbi:MAG TPA: hypothetical protein VF173_17720 [Thermoanaerobaculia bacterium]|nr:hypothetical protein [Thermoanaerobaculia bacterium]
MKTFSVYEHPALGLEALKVGFCWPALVLGILWMLARKLWSFLGLWFALYVALFILVLWSGGIESQATQGWIFIIVLAGLLVLWLIPAFKGNTWREKNLAARGYEKVFTVQAETRDSAIAQVARDRQQQLAQYSTRRSTRFASERTTSLLPQTSRISQLEPAMVRDLRSGRLLYYKHSGHFTIGSIILGLLSGVLAALLLAFPYAYGILYIPFVYINFFMTVFYGTIPGAVSAMVLKLRKVRNAWVSTLVGLVVGLVALYVSWVVWIFGYFGRGGMAWDFLDLLSVAVIPKVLWSLIHRVNGLGYWNVFGYKPTGIVLWINWSIEALIITGAAVGAALGNMMEAPYCEGCGTWCTEKPRVVELQTCESTELKQHMEKKDFTFLEALGPPTPGTNTWLQIDLYQCKKCGLTNTLNIESVTVTFEGKKRKLKKNNILVNLLITSAECESVCQVGQRLTELASARAATEAAQSQEPAV